MKPKASSKPEIESGFVGHHRLSAEYREEVREMFGK